MGEIPLDHFPRKSGKTKVISIRNTVNIFYNLFVHYVVLLREQIMRQLSGKSRKSGEGVGRC